MEVGRDPQLEALASAVGLQIEALNHLRFKFEVQQLMLAGARATFIGETTRELEAAIAKVQASDVAFRDALARAGARLCLSPESTLREVALQAGEPWRYIFEQGRDDLRRSIEAVSALCRENRQLLARGYVATSEALALLGVGTTALSYDAYGATMPSIGPAAILNAKA